MSEISKLLNDAQSTYRTQLNETKKYVSKWEKTGLLEGIDHDYEKHNTAILLENQARELVTENSRIGGASSEEWNGVALPLVRRIFGEIFAKEFVSVQPMNLPSGLIFWLDFKYGTTVGGNQTSGTDVQGNTSSSASPTGGLFGNGKSGYTLKAFTQANAASGLAHGTANSGAALTLPIASASTADLDLANTFYLTSASVAVSTAGTATLTTNDTILSFVTNKAILSTDALTVNYYKNTEVANERGDFEDSAATPAGSVSDGSDDIGIPEMNVELRQEALVAKTRKLKVVWSPEFAQDLNAYHSIDAEAELTSMLSEYISMEIDMEILAMLDRAAATVTANQGTFTFPSAADGYAPLASAANATARYDLGTWAQTLGYEMNKVSNSIHKLTMRGGANFAVVSPEIASIIESIPGFSSDAVGGETQFAAGVTKVGAFANRYTIYKNPYRNTSDGILMGFRGAQFLETGAVYAPYIPLIMTPLVYDPTNFTPRKGVMTRYAKKVVRPEFYGKVAVTIS
jgi:hypothetical protein